MERKTIEKTEKLAPILRLLGAKNPNWQDISCRILEYLDLQELSFVLPQRKQDWKAIGEALMLSLDADPNYQRAKKLLESLKEEGTLDEIASRTNFHRMTISQTLNALERGGIGFSISYAQNEEGRPTKIFKYQ